MSGASPVAQEEAFAPGPGDVLVANQALARIGQPSIAAFTDPTPQGRTINRLYATVRDTLLASRRWRFATAQALLAASGNAPPFPWLAELLRPTNCIMPRYLVAQTTGETYYANDDRAPFLEGMSLVAGVLTPVVWTNINPAVLVYTVQATVPETWEPGFRACMTLQLAAEITVGITGDARFAQAMAEQAARAIAAVEPMMQNEGVSQQQRGSQALAARGG